MSNWNPNQNQNQNNNMMGNPYMGYNWIPQQRLPVYSAPPIQGENAAWQFPMGPNSEIWLPDSEKDVIWWIRTDNYGNRTVKPFKIGDYEEPKPVDLNDVVARLAAVEEWINAKQNKSNAKRTVAASVDAATTTTNV